MTREAPATGAARPGLVYVADPMCSWCWGFAPVIEALVEHFRERLALRLVAGGLRAYQTDPMDLALRSEILDHWRSVARLTGQAFSFKNALPEGFVYDTEPACRAVVVARELGGEAAALAMLRDLHQRFYVRSEDLTRPEVLHRAARGIESLDWELFAKRLDGAEARERTLDDFRFSYALGVRGFPTLLLRRGKRYGLLSSGYQPLERLQPAIEAWLDSAD